MTSLWQLPRSLEVAGKAYPIHPDFRDILEIFSYFQQEDLPEFIRWEIALRLFYDEPIPEAHKQQAMEALLTFISCGQPNTPGPRLMDWDHDAPVIVADVNKVAGQEIRQLPFVHWWTFLSWFHGIGDGQLSGIVSLRDKLRRGKKLEPAEQEFYRQNKHRVDLPKRYSAEDLAQQARLQQLLGE